MTDPVAVPVGECRCPGTPHEEDIVYLAPELSMPGGMAALGAIAESNGDSVKLAELIAGVWIRHGIVAWNLIDEDGPRPVTEAAVLEQLPYGRGGQVVAEKADELYSEAVLAPLQKRLGTLSRSGSTSKATSPRRSSTARRR